MVDRDTFVYYIFNQDKKALYVDKVTGQVLVADDNHLKPDGTPARLQYSPSEWANTSVKYSRNTFYWGLIRDLTTSLTFHGDALTIIKHLFNQKGYETVAYLGIAKLDPLALPYKYKSWHLTELNFTKYERDLIGVKLEGIEGGASKYLKANENTEYEIDLSGDPQVKKFKADGIAFNFTRSFLIQEDSVMYAVPNYFLGMFSSAFEGLTDDVIFQDIDFKESSVYPNEDWFVSVTKETVMRVHGTIRTYFNEADGFELRVEVNDGVTSGGTTQHSLVNILANPRAQGVTEDFAFDQSFTIPAGYRAHMKIYTGSNVGGVPQITIKGLELKCEYQYRKSATFVEGLLAKRVFDLLVQFMTDGEYTAESSWLTSTPDMLYTCGDAFRGLTDVKFRLSFRKFFKSLRYAGLKVANDKIIIERLNTFFDNSSTVLNLGAVKDAKLTLADDLPGNLILAGYEEQEYEDVNGKFEPNQGQQWSTPVTKILKEIDLKCPVRADPIGAELLRINYTQRDTTDNKADKEVWKINIDTVLQVDPETGTEYYDYHRIVYDTFVGIDNWETYFNLELTPKKELLKDGPLLRSLFYKLESEYLKLVSADRNKDIETTLGTQNFKEADPIQIESLGVKLFLPYYFTFTTEVPVNLLSLIEANGYAKVSFVWNDLTWTGFIWDGSIKPADNDTQSWKLLAGPDNDLSKF